MSFRNAVTLEEWVTNKQRELQHLYSRLLQELVELAFESVGLDWKKYVKSDKKLLRPLDVRYLKGDYSKAKKAFGWEPRVKFKDLIELMVKEDIECWEKSLKGEKFPWDAPTYPENINIVTRTKSN